MFIVWSSVADPVSRESSRVAKNELRRTKNLSLESDKKQLDYPYTGLLGPTDSSSAILKNNDFYN